VQPKCQKQTGGLALNTHDISQAPLSAVFHSHYCDATVRGI
jgi:hypothetical protein